MFEQWRNYLYNEYRRVGFDKLVEETEIPFRSLSKYVYYKRIPKSKNRAKLNQYFVKNGRADLAIADL